MPQHGSLQQWIHKMQDNCKGLSSMQMLHRRWITLQHIHIDIWAKIASHNFNRTQWANAANKSSHISHKPPLTKFYFLTRIHKWVLKKLLLKCVIQRNKLKCTKQNAKLVWPPLSVWEHKVLSGGGCSKNKVIQKRNEAVQFQSSLEITPLFEFAF